MRKELCRNTGPLSPPVTVLQSFSASALIAGSALYQTLSRNPSMVRCVSPLQPHGVQCEHRTRRCGVITPSFVEGGNHNSGGSISPWHARQRELSLGKKRKMQLTGFISSGCLCYSRNTKREHHLISPVLGGGTPTPWGKNRT